MEEKRRIMKIISLQFNNVFSLVKSAAQVMNWISLGGVSRGSQMLTIPFFERHPKRNSLAKAEQQVQSTATIVFLFLFLFGETKATFHFCLLFSLGFHFIRNHASTIYVAYKFPICQSPYQFQFFRMNRQIEIFLVLI